MKRKRIPGRVESFQNLIKFFRRWNKWSKANYSQLRDKCKKKKRACEKCEFTIGEAAHLSKWGNWSWWSVYVSWISVAESDCNAKNVSSTVSHQTKGLFTVFLRGIRNTFLTLYIKRWFALKLFEKGIIFVEECI